MIDDDEDDEEEEEEEKISVPLTITMAIIGVYIFFGALLFGKSCQFQLIRELSGRVGVTLVLKVTDLKQFYFSLLLVFLYMYELPYLP